MFFSYIPTELRTPLTIPLPQFAHLCNTSIEDIKQCDGGVARHKLGPRLVQMRERALGSSSTP